MRVLLRGLIATFGICAIFWSANVIPAYREDAPLANTARRILAGDTFTDSQLSAIRRLVELAPKEYAPSTSFSELVIRILLLESELKSRGAESATSDIASLRGTVRASLGQSPSNSLMWLTAFWLDLLDGKSANAKLLHMSYLTGPNEAWIAVRRSAVALSVFPSLPNEIAEYVLAEFLGLVRSGLYVDAANILTGPGWVMRKDLLSRLDQIDEASRRGFEKALASKDLNDVQVPAVNEPSSRPF